MHISNLFTVQNALRWSLAAVGLLVLIIITMMVGGFTRSYQDNQIFYWTMLGVLIGILAMFGSFFFLLKSSRHKTVSLAIFTLTLLLLSFGSTVATFVYVPGEYGAVVVPHGNHAHAYDLATGNALAAWPWQVDIYTPRDVLTFRWAIFQTADQHRVSVTIRYSGQFVNLFKKWSTPDQFFSYWDQQCHRELDPLMAAIRGDDAFRSLQSRCAAFTPIEETLSRMTEGQNVSLRLGV